MIYKIYIRLQRCTTNDRKAFVARQHDAHGIAKGEIRYYLIEASSWTAARAMLRGHDIIGHSQLAEITAQGFTKDIGTARPSLGSVNSSDVPAEYLTSADARRLGLMRQRRPDPDQEETRPRIKCDQCELLSINGVCCHETGCPNMGARWDAIELTWVKQRRCFDCGEMVDATNPCCQRQDEDEETAQAIADDEEIDDELYADREEWHASIRRADEMPERDYFCGDSPDF